MGRRMKRGWGAAGMAAALVMGLAGAAGSGRAAEAPRPYAWSVVPFGAGGFVDGFVYHPKAAGLLYARTDIGGLYRYDAKGRRWIALLDHLGRDDRELMGVLSVAVDPADPNKLYAACGEYLGQWGRLGAVLRSDDRGQTWKKTELTIKLGGNSDGRGTGERLQVDPNAPNILLLGSSQDGLWKSADGGKSFAKAASAGARLSLVLFDPRSGAPGAPSRTVYVGSADGEGGLYVSHDGGASFAPAPGAPRLIPQHAVLAPDATLYVAFAAGDGKNAVNPGWASRGGVWKMDPGGHWSEITPERPGGSGGQGFGYSGVDIDPSHPGTLVVSTLDRWGSGDDIYRSSDGGAHWTALGAQSRHDAAPYPWLVAYMAGKEKMGHWISDVKINPFNPDELIYGTGYGLWMSRNLTAAGSDRPVQFDFAVQDLEEAATTQLVSPVSGATLFAAMGDVAGGGWDDVSKTPGAGLFLPTTESNTSVDYAALKPAFVARIAANAPTHGFYSEEDGASWVPFGSTPYVARDAKGNWRGPGVIAVSAGATSLVWAPEKDSGYVSTDKGRTWKPAAGWPADRDVALVPVADKAADRVFYLLDRSANAILGSIDGGASFKPIITGVPAIAGYQGAQLSVVPGRVRDLWLAAPYGLLHSAGPDKPLSNIKGVDEAWRVGFGKPAPGQAYPTVFLWGKVKGREGLYRSDDVGISWVRINDDRHQFGSIDALSGDPLDYGVVYIAPGGRGVMVGRIASP